MPFSMLIDGLPETGASHFPVINPATQEAFAECPKADEAVLNRAVAAAKAAFPGWAATPIDDRAACVAALSDAMEARATEFAHLLTSEQGKPLDQAKGEVQMSIHALRVYAAMRPEARVLKDDGTRRTIEHRAPLGVVAAMCGAAGDVHDDPAPADARTLPSPGSSPNAGEPNGATPLRTVSTPVLRSRMYTAQLAR